MKEEVFYIYRHIRKDNDSIFYIGIGKAVLSAKTHNAYYTRAYNRTKRNDIWKRTVAKTDYEVEIIFETTIRKIAIEKEIEFIALYGRRDLSKGTLVNLTDGGEGTTNNKQSVKTIEKRLKSYNSNKENHIVLKGKDSPNAVKVVEVATGRVFDTLTEASEYLGMSSANLSRLIGAKNRKNTSGFKYLNESLNKEYVCRKQDKKIYEYGTGNIINSISEASRLFGVSNGSLKAQLSGEYENKTALVYYEDYLKGMKPDDFHISGKKHLKVINSETKEIYESVAEASRVSGVNKSTLIDRLKGEVRNNTPYMLLSEYNEKFTTNIHFLESF